MILIICFLFVKSITVIYISTELHTVLIKRRLNRIYLN
nr:MAG TPA: hypothetical protein [Caudoviricetes sp.]